MYTAFLFGQCEGRDLWQTPLLPVHLVVQALLCGSATLALLSAFAVGISGGQAFSAEGFAKECLVVMLILNLLMILGEIAVPHTTDNAQYASRLMIRGPFRFLFWLGAVLFGTVVPLMILLWGPYNGGSTILASGLAVAGVLAFEWCFVMAGQSVPNS
jgi:Ni/Fe-hydrogenase subunit HybB-like protein